MIKGKNKILVTGCAGFIGSHLVKKLLSMDYAVFGLDNINDYYDQSLKYSRLHELGVEETNYNSYTQSKIFGKFCFIKLDITDKKNISSFFEKESFDVVINLAGQAGVRYSITNPKEYITSNIDGFLNILELCKEFNIQHLLYASSSSVYGLNNNDSFSTNDDTSTPISIYAATKKSNELMAHVYSHLYGITTTGLRFFTVYGPSARPDMALHLFVKSAFEKRPIDIFNNAQMLRDFTYIDDIVEMTVRALDVNLSKKDLYKVYNIGNGQPKKLMDFINAIEYKLEMKLIKNYLPLQAGDVVNTCANMEETIKDLGQMPKTSIQEGVNSFIDWYIKFYEIKK